MRMLVSSLTLLFAVTLVAVADDPPAGKDAPPAKKKAPPTKDDAPLQAGKNLPGPFHPYNLTGPHKQHFHCLISEHGLDPMVMIFHKNVEVADPLPSLLKKLDTTIEKNPAVRLGAFVVFLPKAAEEVVGSDDKNDDARNALAKKVEQADADMKLKHVLLCLDNKADVEKYHLNDANLVTIILYKKFEIMAVFALPQNEFTEAAIEKIMAAVADKLGAKRQK